MIDGVAVNLFGARPGADWRASFEKALRWIFRRATTPPLRIMTIPTVATVRIRERDIALVRALAACVIAIVTLVLLGWVASIELLTRGIPALPAMMPSTAVLFALSAVALDRATFAPRAATSRILAFLIALSLVPALIAYLGEMPSMPVLPWAMPTGIGQQLPGVPAPNTLLALFCLALAVLFLDSAAIRGMFPAEIAAGMATTIAVTALIGHSYGAAYLYGISAYAGMSLPSVLCTMALSAGIFAARPQRGLIAALHGHSLGVTVANRLIPLAIGVPIAFGWLVCIGLLAGSFDIPLGVALLTVATILVALFAIGRTAVTVERLEIERQRVTEERQKALQQAAAQERFRSIFENTSIALVERDTSGLAARWSELQDASGNRVATPSHELIEWMFAAAPVVDANPAALALFGASSKEALVASWREALLPETIAVFLGAVRAVAAGQKTFEAEVPIRGPGGTQRHLIASLAFPEDPPLGRVLISFVDVTERRRAEQSALEAGRAHEEAAHIATEAERHRLARELHDGALQELAALKLLLEAECTQRGSESLRLALGRTGAIIREVRAAVEDLRPPELARGSLADAIANHAEALTVQSATALTCDVPADIHLPDWVAREVYRIAQEAIGNAIRHGRPRRLAVRLWQLQRETGLEIEDDGTGFDAAAVCNGSGLANMSERADRISASLTIDSAPRNGTRIRLLVPCDGWSEPRVASASTT